MKRYYSLDYFAMTKHNLDATDWIILEDIQFRQVYSDSGYCEDTRSSMAMDHNLSTDRFKKRVSSLADRGYLKRNSKNNLRTTKKWADIQRVKNNPTEEEGVKNNPTEKEGVKNNPVGGYKQPDEGVKNNPTLPIRENLDSKRELKNTKKDFRLLLEEIEKEAPRKSKVTYTDKGFEAYTKIEDKNSIKELYIKHQEQNEGYAQRISAFLADFDAHKKELTGANDTFNLSGKDYKTEEDF